MSAQGTGRGKGRGRGGPGKRHEPQDSAPQPKKSDGLPSPSKTVQGNLTNLISEIHGQIGCEHSETVRDDASLLVEIKNEIQEISKVLHEDSGQDSKANQIPAKQPVNKTVNKQSTQATSSPIARVTLCTLVKNMKSDLMKTSSNLALSRRENKEMKDQIVNMYRNLGFESDTQGNDKDNIVVKEIIKQVEGRHAELREHLKLLDQKIAASKEGMEQQSKISKDKSKNDKKTPKKKDIDVEKKTSAIQELDVKTTISAAVDRISELQEHKNKMDCLALQVIHIRNKNDSNDRQNQRTVHVTLPDFEQAIKDMEKYIAELQKTPDTQQQIGKQYKELEQKLTLLGQAIMSDETKLQRDKIADGNSKKDREKSDKQKPKKDAFNFEASIATISSAITRFDELQKDEREISQQLALLEHTVTSSGSTPQPEKDKDVKSKKEKDKTSKQKSKTDTSSNASKIGIISSAITRFEELQIEQRGLIYNIDQVSHFAKGLEKLLTENTDSRTHSAESNKTKKKSKNSKDSENLSSTGTKHPDYIKSKDDGNDFQKYMEFLTVTYNRMEEEISHLKTSLKHLWNTAIAASHHVSQVTEKKVNIQTQFEVEKIEMNEEMHRFDNEVKYLVNKALNCTEEVQKMKREVELVQKENDSLQQRLSKIAGDKLTVGNPDITNLGDPNRPMKIGEWFSELYDNEWTDAMDLCQKKLGKKIGEDAILQALYKTLMACYSICDEKSQTSTEKARKHFQEASKELMVDIQEVEIMKPLIGNRKLAADAVSKQLFKEIEDGKNPDATKFLKDIDDKILVVIRKTPYFAKCLTLCWKMIVQNPPMVLLGGPEGKEFNRNIFREYTSSGTKVIFTVWPALYLHENGPLLVKGVVKVK